MNGFIALNYTFRLANRLSPGQPTSRLATTAAAIAPSNPEALVE